jgi:hypothetical protein
LTTLYTEARTLSSACFYSDEYVLLRTAHVLPEFIMYINIETCLPPPRLEESVGPKYAREIIDMCNNLEMVLQRSVESYDIDTQSTKHDMKDASNDACDSSFEQARSKQALVTAVGNIVDLFTKIKLAVILNRLSN